MNDKFFELKKEKQDRIMNAALKVFALQGYHHASTDEIVREAAISKGLLFHYFENKLGVYRFLYDYSVRYLALELQTQLQEKETDVFVLYKQMELARMRVMNVHPYLPLFLYHCRLEKSPEAVEIILGKASVLQKVYQPVFARMDFGSVSKNISGKQLCKMIDLTIKGLIEEHFMEMDVVQPQKLSEEIMAYLDMLREMVTSSLEVS